MDRYLLAKDIPGQRGGHFHQTDNLEMCYSGGMAIDPDNVNEVYGSVPVEGRHGRVYELIRYRLDAAGTVVSSEAVTRDSEKNNVRPYLVQGSAGSPLRLTWMYGDYYDWIVSNIRPGYPTAIHSDFKGMKQNPSERQAAEQLLRAGWGKSLPFHWRWQPILHTQKEPCFR